MLPLPLTTPVAVALALSLKGTNRAGLVDLRTFPDIKHEGLVRNQLIK